MPDPLDAPSFSIASFQESCVLFIKRVLFSASRVKRIALGQKGIVPVRYGSPNRFIARQAITAHGDNSRREDEKNEFARPGSPLTVPPNGNRTGRETESTSDSRNELEQDIHQAMTARSIRPRGLPAGCSLPSRGKQANRRHVPGDGIVERKG
ncbi:hypothetical protein SDC9_182262 [bioreactor metagenome]|uniref:Uncharacterized protein n=1 Tax=bioreactor metagenome TaxID=1076179 RepID=A0A645H729_9ZZZZ